jgi:hypothetical protein
MTPENAVEIRDEGADLTPENAEPLAKYADHLGQSPLTVCRFKPL